MNYAPIAADLAVRLSRLEAGSARPDAPVVSDAPRRRRLHDARTTAASRLHRVATWLEPAEPCRVAPTRG